MGSTALAHEVREKRLDFYFGVRPDATMGSIELKPLSTLQGVPFVRAGHPLTQRTRPGLREILTFPVVHGSCPRWLMQRIATALGADNGVRPSVSAAVVVNEYGAVRDLVLHTDMVGFAPAAQVRNIREREDFVSLVLPPREQPLLQMDLYLGTGVGRRLPPPVRSIVEEIRTVVSEFDAVAVPAEPPHALGSARDIHASRGTK